MVYFTPGLLPYLESYPGDSVCHRLPSSKPRENNVFHRCGVLFRSVLPLHRQSRRGLFRLETWRPEPSRITYDQQASLTAYIESSLENTTLIRPRSQVVGQTGLFSLAGLLGF